MFETFYSFTNTPFSRDMPADQLYVSMTMNETVSRLQYAAQKQLFAILTGDCGTGKTTTIRNFTESLDRNRFVVLYISDSKLRPRHFYKGLLEQLGCTAPFYSGEAKRQLHKEIEVLRGVQNVQPVVIVDEAHLLERDMLEELRFLLNFRMDSQSPLALILVGQNELGEKLFLSTYAAIRQRIDIQCRLGTYDRANVGAYIHRHLEYAGTDREIFSDGAIDEIYLYTNGIARIINKLCTHSLIFGASQGKRIIDDHMVKLVIKSEME